MAVEPDIFLSASLYFSGKGPITGEALPVLKYLCLCEAVLKLSSPRRLEKARYQHDCIFISNAMFSWRVGRSDLITLINATNNHQLLLGAGARDRILFISTVGAKARAPIHQQAMHFLEWKIIILHQSNKNKLH